jgi:prevent-host-death family protein
MSVLPIKRLEDQMVVNLKEDIKPISYIETNGAEMMKYVTEVKNPVIITQNGEAKAVLVDIETYQNTQNAFHLIKMLQISEHEIEKRNFKTADTVFDNMEEILGIK